MKTRRMRRNQRGGVKVNPNHDPMNALTRRMGTLGFGVKKSKPVRFGVTTKKNRFAKKSVLQTLNRNKKKPAKTLRGLVRTQLVQRNEMTTNMEQFEPAEYIRKVGRVFTGLGGVRERIEDRGKIELLDGFDMIILNIYEGLPKIQGAMGKSTNEEMNGSNHSDDVDEMLEEIEEIGEELIELSNTYRRRVKTTNQNVSNIQVQLIGVAEAVNQVLVGSVSKVAKANPNTNQTMSGFVRHLGDGNSKHSYVNDLASLFAGLGV